MDNLTHSFVGLTAAKAGLEKLSPGATTLCVIAANAPDSDIVVLAFGDRWTFLHHHRGITHAIVGVIGLAVILPLIFYGVDRLWSRYKDQSPKTKLKGLMIASFIASATHPLLDWTNNYGIRFFLPWSQKWSYGDLVFIVDPYIWLILGGAVFLLTARTKFLKVHLGSACGCHNISRGGKPTQWWLALSSFVCAAMDRGDHRVHGSFDQRRTRALGKKRSLLSRSHSSFVTGAFLHLHIHERSHVAMKKQQRWRRQTAKQLRVLQPCRDSQIHFAGTAYLKQTERCIASISVCVNEGPVNAVRYEKPGPELKQVVDYVYAAKTRPGIPELRTISCIETRRSRMHDAHSRSIGRLALH